MSSVITIYKYNTLLSLPQFHISVILACPESFLWSRTSRRIPDKREWHRK